MDYYFMIYIFLCIILWITAVVRLSQMPRPVSSIIVAVFFILIFIFYGIRWFYGPTIDNDPNGTWPPIINMCPDYLVYFKNGSADTCVDLIGVNRSNDTLVSWTTDNGFSNPPKDQKKYFNYIYKPGMSADIINNVLCPAAKAAGLTWEGITNGETCTYLPPGSHRRGGGGKSSKCDSPPPVPGSVVKS